MTFVEPFLRMMSSTSAIAHSLGLSALGVHARCLTLRNIHFLLGRCPRFFPFTVATGEEPEMPRVSSVNFVNPSLRPQPDRSRGRGAFVQLHQTPHKPSLQKTDLASEDASSGRVCAAG